MQNRMSLPTNHSPPQEKIGGDKDWCGDIQYSTYYRQDIHWAREGDACICLKVGKEEWNRGMGEMYY